MIAWFDSWKLLVSTGTELVIKVLQVLWEILHSPWFQGAYPWSGPSKRRRKNRSNETSPGTWQLSTTAWSIPTPLSDMSPLWQKSCEAVRMTLLSVSLCLELPSIERNCFTNCEGSSFWILFTSFFIVAVSGWRRDIESNCDCISARSQGYAWVQIISYFISLFPDSIAHIPLIMSQAIFTARFSFRLPATPSYVCKSAALSCWWLPRNRSSALDPRDKKTRLQ